MRMDSVTIAGQFYARDVNAARNILRTGLCALVGGAHV